MTRVHWLEALLALTVWVSIYLYFFRTQISKWVRERPKRRAMAGAAARKKAEAQTQMLDDLANKYLPPPVVQPPPAPPKH